MQPAIPPAFKLLRASIPQERSAWLEAWKAWPLLEPAVHPAYGEAFLAPDERLVLAQGRNTFLPLVIRPLASGRCDLSTPYGYGGPYGEGGQAFWDGLNAWAAQIGAVTLVARLPLFDAARFDGGRTHVMDNVVVDLTMSAEARWQDYEHKVRKNVKRAQSHGLRVEIDPQGERLSAFLRIYEDTMNRREAADGYRFDRAFFEKLIREMGDSVCFFHTLVDDHVISTELVLHGRDGVYSFLGGTDDEWFAHRPNDLLKHAIMEWGAAQGKRRFVLGGGYRRDDGIFRYKRAFAPTGVVPFYLGHQTFDEVAAQAMVERRRATEPGWTPREGFFPAYRAPGEIRERVAA